MKSETETTTVPSSQACGNTIKNSYHNISSHNEGGISCPTGFSPLIIKPTLTPTANSCYPNNSHQPNPTPIHAHNEAHVHQSFGSLTPNYVNVNADNNKVPHDDLSVRSSVGTVLTPTRSSRTPFFLGRSSQLNVESNTSTNHMLYPQSQSSSSHHHAHESRILHSNHDSYDDPAEKYKNVDNEKRINGKECPDEKTYLEAQEFDEDEFDRKKSRSLPKSFMSMRNGLRNVLLPR